MRLLISLAVVVALGAVGWTIGGEYYEIDPEMGERLGAFCGVIFGLLIFFAIRTQQ